MNPEASGEGTSVANTVTLDMSQLRDIVGDLVKKLQGENNIPHLAAIPQYSLPGESVAGGESVEEIPMLNSRQHLNMIAPKPTPVWVNDIELWFGTLEAQFASARVTSQSSRFQAVLGVLTPDVAKVVSEFIRNPPKINPYDALKVALITRLGDSTTEKIRKVLRDMDLGDRKPSQLLREMRNSASDAFPDETLRVLWEAKLPSKVRTVLVCSGGPLESTAELADRVMEACVDTRIMEMGGNPFRNSGSGNESHADSTEGFRLVCEQNKKLLECNELLQQRINQLSKRHTDIDRCSRWDKKSAGTSERRRSESRSKSRTRVVNGVCWYHKFWGEKARNCAPGCDSYTQFQKN